MGRGLQGKFILKPKWEYYFNDQDGHVVKLRGYYEDGQKEKERHHRYGTT